MPEPTPAAEAAPARKTDERTTTSAKETRRPDEKDDDRADRRDRADGSRESRRRSVGVWWWALIGVASALVGLLPWLVTGMRMPLQNLWSTGDASDLPVVLLPFSQYALTHIIGLLVFGGALAGIAARSLRHRASWAFGLALAGVLAVQGVAVVQTTVVVGAGLQERSESGVYLLALVGVAILSILVSAAAAALIAKTPRGGAVIGFAIGACALAPWLSALLAPIGSVPGDAAIAILGLLRWVPPILVGIAIAWAGVGTIGRLLGAVVALGLVWIVPALTTGIGNSAGSRVLASDVPQMLEYGAQVVLAALTVPEVALPPVVLCVIVAVIGLVIRSVVSRARRSENAAAAS